MTLDERDSTILAERQAALDANTGPRVGDLIRFPDGGIARISHHWGNRVQTSPYGSFYLGNGYVSFSGGLDPAIPLASLTEINGTVPARAWFFHHGDVRAHNGVPVEYLARMYDTTAPNPNPVLRQAFPERSTVRTFDVHRTRTADGNTRTRLQVLDAQGVDRTALIFATFPEIGTWDARRAAITVTMGAQSPGAQFAGELSRRLYGSSTVLRHATIEPLTPASRSAGVIATTIEREV